MPILKIASSLAIFATVGVCHAQEASLLMPMEKAAAVVAVQTSSPTNYQLLEPIANKPIKRHLASVGMLQPMQPMQATAKSKVGLDVTTGEGKITVTPLSFKRGIFDEHEFKVHNTSGQMLRNAKILLTAPVGSVVQQVAPKPDSVDGLSIMVTVDQIAPGAHQIINVSINYPRNEFAKFETMVTSEQWGQDAYVGETIATAKVNEIQEPVSSFSVEMPDTQQQWKPQTETLKPKVPVLTASATTRRSSTETPPGSANPVVVEVAEKAAATQENKEVTGVTEEAEAAIAVEKPIDNATVMSYFRGPAEVVAGEANDYQIDIQNLSSETVDDIIIQLSIPQSMKVTVLDRDAWYDAQNRKISWKLDRIDGRALETIRYKAIAKEPCQNEQSIVVGMDSQVQSTSSLKTTAR